MSCRSSRLSVALLVLASGLMAQEGGFITGVVRDRSGGSVSGAELRIQSEDTGAMQRLVCDAAGNYSTAELAPGGYKITVRSGGFRTVTRSDLSVRAGKTMRADFSIDLLPLQAEITVTTSQSSDNPVWSGVTVSREAPAENLPANGRDVHALFSLMPGATVTSASISSGGQFTVDGQRPNENSFRVNDVSGNIGIGIVSVPGAFPGGALPGMTTIRGHAEPGIEGRDGTRRLAVSRLFRATRRPARRADRNRNAVRNK